MVTFGSDHEIFFPLDSDGDDGVCGFWAFRSTSGWHRSALVSVQPRAARRRRCDSYSDGDKHQLGIPSTYCAGNCPQRSWKERCFTLSGIAWPYPTSARSSSAQAPGPADQVLLAPGQSWSYQVELTSAYDLSHDGRYTIEYLSRGAHGAQSATLSSEKLYLWLEGRRAKGKRPPPPPPDGNISYTGNCSASQQTTLHSAVENAKTLSGSSTSYLGDLNSTKPRYEEWFGEYTANRRATAHDHFVKLTDAFSTKSLTLDCQCKKPYYAYVYPPNLIRFTCAAFFGAHQPSAQTPRQAH